MNVVFKEFMVALVENNISFSFHQTQRGASKGITIHFGTAEGSYFFTPTEKEIALYAPNRTFTGGYIYSFEDVAQLAFKYWTSSEDSYVLEEWEDIFRERGWVEEVTVLKPK